MLLDDSYLLGEEGALFIKKKMQELLENTTKLIEENIDISHHGWFVLKYEYFPKKYFILFEGEFNSFNIRIINQDNGFVALKKLIDYPNILRKADIVCAIEKMKEQLQLSIEFYKVIDDKLFRQVDGKYKRVKGW